MTVVPQPGEVFYDDEGNKSVVLPDGCDPNYDPPQDELEEYAEFIGIDVKAEKDLMWIALEGLRTPLPTNWRACQTGDDEVYYFNFDTGESLWDHPMDNIFKEKVIAERAKLKSKGSTNTGSATTASVKAKKEAEPAKSTMPGKQQESVTKALTASLLGSGGVSKGLSSNLQGLANPKSGRLSALGGNTIDGGTSSSRIQPDVSDLLKNASQSAPHSIPSTTFGSPSGLHSSSLPQKGLSNAGVTSASSARPQNSLEMEKNIRRRIEAEFETKFKAEVAERERNYNLEKNRLETSLQKSQESLESAWKVEKETLLKTMTMSTNRETNEMNQNWQRRIKELRDVIAKREEEIKAAKNKSDGPKEKGLDIEEFTKQLKETNEKKVQEKREELISRMNNMLKQLDDEQNKTLEELSRRAKTFVESTRKRIEQESTQSLLQIQSKSQENLSKAMSDLAKLKEELKKQQQESQALAKAKPKQQPSLASLRAGKANSSSGENDQVRKAQKEADDMVRKVDDELDEEMEKIEESFKDEQRKLSSELETLQKEIDTLTKNTPALPEPEKEEPPTVKKTTTVTTLTASDRSKLSEEEAQMRNEGLKRIAAFEKETEELCKEKKLSVAKSSSPSSPLGSTAGNAGGQTSAIEKAKQNHLQIVKQLEFTHEQTMRKLRDAHHRSLASQDRYDVRKSSEFTKLLNEKKKAWLAINPTPCYNVDELPDLSDLEEKEFDDLPPIDDDEVEEIAKKRLESFKPIRINIDTSAEAISTGATSAAVKAFEAEERDTMKKRIDDYKENAWHDVQTEEQKQRDEIERLEAAVAKAKSAAIEKRNLEDANKRRTLEDAQKKKNDECKNRIQVLRSRLQKAEEGVENAKKKIISVSTPRVATATPDEGRGITVEVEEYSFQNDGSFMLHTDAEKEVAELKRKRDELLDRMCAEAAAQQEQLTKILRLRQRPPIVPPIVNEPKSHQQSSHVIMGKGIKGTHGMLLEDPASSSTQLLSGRGRPSSDDGAGRRETAEEPPQGSKGMRSSAAEYYATPAGRGQRQSSRSAVSSSEPQSPNEELASVPLAGKRAMHHPGVPMPETPPPDAVYPHHPQARDDPAMWCHMLRQRIREQKRILREKQRTMETLREEWRRDMQQAKLQQDKRSIEALREVRRKMEDQARRLNAAVLAVKMERDQLEEFSRWRFGGQDSGEAVSGIQQESILRLVKQMTDQSRHLEGVLRHESEEEFGAAVDGGPSKKENHRRKSSIADHPHHSHHSDRKSKKTKEVSSSTMMQEKTTTNDRHMSRMDSGIRSPQTDGMADAGFENGDEIRWQKVNYIRQVEKWLQQQSH